MRRTIDTVKTLVAWALLLPIAATGVAQAGGIGTVKIPVRWCALEGTSAAENPDCGCKTSTKGVLWSRHERTSEAIYIPDCNVTWRSGAMMQQPSFPVIADPCDPAVDGSCPGVTGDIVLVEGSGDLTELNAAFVACNSAWDAVGVGSVGVIGLNVRRYINPDGTVNLNAGFAGIPTFNNGPSQVLEGAFSVIDNDFTWDPVGCTPPGSCESQIPMLDGDPTDQITGHEGGHAISMNHSTPPPGTLMNDTAPSFDFLTSGGPGQNSQVCPDPVPQPTSQCGRIRLQAICHIPGAVVSVPVRGAVASALVADEYPLKLDDMTADEIDLALVALIDDPVTSTASFAWRTGGEFPDFAIDLSYAFAIDRDFDAGTGGAPSTIGFPMTLTGVELVGEVLLTVMRPSPTAPKQFTTFQRLWEYNGSTFERVNALTAEAADMQGVIDRIAAEPGFAIFGGRVSHGFNRGLLGGASVVRFQALARDLISGGMDLTPVGPFYLIAPQLPTCELAPSIALPGQQVTLTASGMGPDQDTVLFFGPDPVAMGTTDGSGFADTSFIVPALTAPGDHLVTLGAQDANDAMTADCVLSVLGVSAPGEPDDLRLENIGLQLRLQWNAPGDGCAQDDYAIYSGDLDALRATGYDHLPLTCSTGGITGLSTASRPGNRYFLAVDLTKAQEGSYGRDAANLERPQSSTACRRVQNTDVCF